MLITKEFIDIMLKRTEDNDVDFQISVYNWTIFVITGSSFLTRLSMAFEILMGRKYSQWISNDEVAHNPNVELFDLTTIRKKK